MSLAISDEIHFRPEGPYTKKLVQTERTILMIVCLRPGQAIPPHGHEKREAFVHVLQGEVRFTPGEGETEMRAGEVRLYDGAEAVSPRNTGNEDAVFLVTLVRKKYA